MKTSDISSMLSFRLRKLAKSGVPANEIASSLRELMEADRAQKSPANESPSESTLAFLRQAQTRLRVM